MALDDTQRGVMRNMVAGCGLTLAVLIGAIVWRPAFLTAPAALAERFAETLRWDALVLLCLVAAIGNLARHRFFTPADINGGGLTSATDTARVLQAVLQNTLEQAVIAVLAHLLWAAATPSGWSAAVPAAVLLFVAGRIGFAAGYRNGAAARAFGFALTFYPTVALLVVALAALVWQPAGG